MLCFFTHDLDPNNIKLVFVTILVTMLNRYHTCLHNYEQKKKDSLSLNIQLVYISDDKNEIIYIYKAFYRRAIIINSSVHSEFLNGSIERVSFIAYSKSVLVK